MILLPLLLAAAQVRPGAAPPAPPANAAAAEQQARRALAARGMSAAGIETIVATQRRHLPAIAAIVQRGRAAEAGVQAALAKRPVDVDGFARSVAARTDAAVALQREQAQAATEQMRALSPADRAVLAGAMTATAPAKR